MRLIDADNFLERFEKMCETETDNVIAMVLRGALVDEPTAYDVDKVMEQLEDRSTLSRPVGWSKSYEIVTLADAIGIVKGGGADA